MNADNIKKGYLPVYRSFFEHDFWKEKREFSRAEAWLDILQTVSYDSNEKSIIISGKLVTYNKGQYPASIRFLQERWGWKSIKRVELFLKMLQKGDMISIDKRQGQNVITVCNYDSYNSIESAKETAKRQTGDAKETAKRQQRDETNKVNKETSKEVNISFEEFWEAYAKKVGTKANAEKKWNSLTDQDRTIIMAHIEPYVKSFAADRKQFQPYPETFLNGRRWENEGYTNEAKVMPLHSPAQPVYVRPKVDLRNVK